MTLGEIKRYMKKTVIYDGDEYILIACVMFLHPTAREFCYSARIVSKKTNTVMEVPIEKTEGKRMLYE